MEKTLIIAAAFLAGSVPFGWIYVKLFKKTDIRKIGSGSTGATNVYRTCGLPAAVFVFSLDFLKGFLPVFFAGGNLWFRILTGLAVVAGHNYSVFLKGRGGKGVAAASGIAFALAPAVFLFALAAFGMVFAVTKIISVSSLSGCLVFLAMSFILKEPVEIRTFSALVFLVILFAHRKNIGRIFRGEEKRISKI